MIRQLRDDDAQAYADLRRQALLEAPRAFASSPEDDCASSPEGRCANCCGGRSEMFNEDAELVQSDLAARKKMARDQRLAKHRAPNVVIIEK